MAEKRKKCINDLLPSFPGIAERMELGAEVMEYLVKKIYELVKKAILKNQN